MSLNIKVRIPRNIVFFGETGTGKSSAINIILGSNAFAVSNDSRPCTDVNCCHEFTSYDGTRYNLWDTRGLGEGKSFLFQALFRDSSTKELKKFLKERHQGQGIDLLVFCVRGSRATEAAVKHYHTFCSITRRMVAPVAIMVTHLEKEPDMGNWWIENASHFKKFKMEFDDHVCITTLPKHPRSAESKKNLIELITRDHPWERKETGSYFGSRVPKSNPTVERTGWILFKSMHKGSANDGSLISRPSNTATPSTRERSLHTLDSPEASTSPSSLVEPPSPRTATAFGRVPRINTSSDLPGIVHPSQSPSENTSGTRTPSPSIFSPGSQSSYTSQSEEANLQPCAAEHEDYLDFEFPADNVKRRNEHATQCGAFGEIWDCDLILPWKSPCRVAVKAMKISANHKDLEPYRKKLHRELKVWRKLQHKNVVPLLGVVLGFGPLQSMMLKMPAKNRLLRDAAAGLCYLHKRNIIHGDLHSDNVLIDEHGTACLTDFGLSFLSEFVGTSYLKSSICGIIQFADPALVQRVHYSQELVYPTKPCDVYSFGGVMLHVMSGKKPYDGNHHIKVYMTVLKGERPQIPIYDTIPDWHRLKIHMCWDVDESKRPSAEDLVKMSYE